ncbi:sodium:proton exchanger [Mycoplasma wenyonii]|uniref:Sodium:proton exchanger n=1 Tax=Mycoplasma wenyonii TaxID=65123 RepID=A0A328PLE8_9MOLU|nr:sodium:proton exchanger [Mycoplasma wenyonii]
MVTGAGVLTLSFLFSESIKGVLNRFNLSEKFVGSSLLATGTSFPEVINAITAGFYDRESSQKYKYSIDSFYNLTGASLIQIIFLSGLGIVLYHLTKKKKFAQSEYRGFITSTFQNKTFLWFLFTAELVLLLIAVSFPSFSQKIGIGSVSFLPFLFLVIWACYLVFSRKDKEDFKSYSNIFDQLSNFKFLGIFGFIFICFSGLSFLNFNIVTMFEKTFRIPRNIGLGTILSLVTSFPEFSSFFFLFKSRHFGLASAGIFGSALFNLFLPSLTQSIKVGWFLSELVTNSNLQASLIGWLGLAVALNVIFLIAFYKNKKGNYILNFNYPRWNVFWSWVLLTSYLTISFIIFPIFLKSETAGDTK